MKRFSSKKLGRQQSFGELLRWEREQHGLDLRQISFKLKIPEKYLAALEDEELSRLPIGSYGKYFLTQYAEFLKLPVAKLVAEYNIRADYVGSGRPITAPAVKKLKTWSLKRTIWILLIIILVSYLGLEARRLFLPPPLNVLNPLTNVEIEDLTILVSGTTVSGATVLLNGANVPVDENGNFNQEVTLQPGLNTITLTARRAYSQPVIVRREILVKTLPTEANF